MSSSPREQETHPTEHVQGIVERVTYHAEDSGYTVTRLKAPGHRDLETAQAERCVVLQNQPGVIRALTHFHWWPPSSSKHQ